MLCGSYVAVTTKLTPCRRLNYTMTGNLQVCSDEVHFLENVKTQSAPECIAFDNVIALRAVDFQGPLNWMT